MKKLIIVSASLLASFVVSSASAAGKSQGFSREYGMAGCGLGSVVIGKRGGQISAATTNGTFSNQLFAISFGTLNCVDGPVNEVAQNMDKFIVANRSALTADVVRGEGETLTALSQVMGCDVKGQEMGRLLKANYGQIFVNEAQPNILTDSIISVIMTDSQVATKCNLG